MKTQPVFRTHNGLVLLVDQTKLIRQQLKRQFPTATFSVHMKRRSGDSSINISWSDGPTKEQMIKAVDPYSSGVFYSSLDRGFSVAVYLNPDGTLAKWGPRKFEGNLLPPADASAVSFRANHINLHRTDSTEAVQKATS